MNSKKEKSGFLVVNDPHYRIGILLAFGVTDKQIHSKIKQYGMKGFDDLNGDKPYAGLTIHNGGNSFIIRMHEWPTRASHYNILQHELFHVCDIALRGNGFTLSSDSCEAWAYLIGNFTEKVYQKLWEKK